MQINTQTTIVIAVSVAVISVSTTSVIWLLAEQQSTRSVKTYGKATPEQCAYHHDLVTKINGEGKWTARYNKAGPLEGRCGESGMASYPKATKAKPNAGLNEHFDARNKWPHCVLLQQPATNQGDCGSCWAVSGTSVIADRICIATGGRQQPRLSVLDVLCGLAGELGDPLQVCALGGPTMLPYQIWNTTGIVTGGLYGSADGCKPYPIPGSCGSPCPWTREPVNLKCDHDCQPLHPKKYDDDKFYGQVPDLLTTINPETKKPLNPVPAVQKTILEDGPVSGLLDVFEDFLHYGSGVYQYTKGKHCYDHLAKIIGWGTENGVDFWIIANSWGETWGEVGFGKVAMDHFHEYSFGDVLL